MHIDSSTSGSAPTSPLPGARSALALLLAINMFNYIDRYIMSAVEPEVRAEFFGEHQPRKGEDASTEVRLEKSSDADFFLSIYPQAKFWTGVLQLAFIVFYMCAAPLFGALADRTSRWLLVAIGIALWSLASGASGLAGVFTALLLTRCLVGVGEAVYGPVAPSVISDLYPTRVRGSVLAWFYAAIPVGSALGYVLGSVVKGSPLGWRWAFFIVVLPGFVLAALCLFMRDPRRGQADATPHRDDAEPLRQQLPADSATRQTTQEPRLAEVPESSIQATERPRFWATCRLLFRTRSWVFCTLGMTAMTFAIGGITWWMPGFLQEHRQVPNVFGGIDPVTFFGGIIVLTGLSATLLGGLAGDKLKPRFSGSYFLVSGIAMLSAVPMIFLFTWLDFPWSWVFLTLAAFCLFFNTGPTNTILANVVHPSIRSSGFAINIFIIHVLGDAISPAILGAIIGDENRYEAAFIVVAVMVLAGGLLWLMGMRYLASDTERAPTRLPQ